MSHPRQALIAMAALTAATLAPAALQHSGIRFNRTASMPVGLYRIVPVVSSVAAICLPDTVLHAALAAGLVVAPGECLDGKEPILKTVYRATEDAPISFTPSGFVVGNRLLPNTAPKLRSKSGEPLTHEPYGSYNAGLWAISDYNPDSFDSRYFGPVSESSVRYYLAPLFLF